MSLHRIRTHPEYVEGCFGCKVSTQRVGYCGQGGQDLTRQRAWDRELALYRDAVKQGVQPETTRTPGIEAALKWSESTGKAYSAEAKLEHDKTTVLERYAV